MSNIEPTSRISLHQRKSHEGKDIFRLLFRPNGSRDFSGSLTVLNMRPGQSWIDSNQHDLVGSLIRHRKTWALDFHDLVAATAAFQWLYDEQAADKRAQGNDDPVRAGSVTP
jgi:hypothetical protein